VRFVHRFNISEQILSKWNNRDFLEDAFCKPLNIEDAITDLEKVLFINLIRVFGKKSVVLKISATFRYKK